MLKKLYSSSREPLKKYRDYNKTTGNSIIHIHFMIKHAYMHSWAMFEVLMQLVVTTCATCLPFQGSANIWRVLQAKVYVTVILPFEGSHLFGFFIHSPLTCWLTGWLDGWLVGCSDACLAGTATGWLRHSLGNWQVHSLPFSEFRGVTDRQRERQRDPKKYMAFLLLFLIVVVVVMGQSWCFPQ